MTEPVAA